MATRTYRIGTIFSRVDGALRKGFYNQQKLPVWFQVYKRFPPKYEPKYRVDTPQVEVRDILYEEDVLRAEIHKNFSNALEPINLMSDQISQSQKLLETCQQYISQGMTKEEALKKLQEPVAKKSYKKIVEEVKEIIPRESNSK